jgi:pimeloyl-ACP methyl ester carboxylesterase
LVWGAQDHLLPPAPREFFIRHLPRHARVETPATFGHAPFLDQPDEVARLVRRFAVEVAIGREAAPRRRPAPRLVAVG